MLAEIVDVRRGAQEGARRCRHEDLATVARRHDPRRLVDVDADVGAGDDHRHSRMEADPDADGAAVGPGLVGESALCGLSRCRGRFGLGEREVARVAFDGHLEAVVPPERRTKQVAVPLEDATVAFRADLLEQGRRSFDVAEEDRDAALGLRRHVA